MTSRPVSTAQSLVGWLPYRLDLVDGRAVVSWVACPRELDDSPPKFAPAAAALVSSSPEPPVATGPEVLARTRELAHPLSPSGFVFHIARCGSTLVSNVLSALPRSLVIKEAQPIDTCLRSDNDLEPEGRARWLTDVVGSLGQRFGGREAQLFVKFTSWNVLHHALIRSCFPDTPTVFLYRDPLETLVSMLRAEPAWQFEVVPGLRRAGLSTADYYARVIGAFLSAGLELAGQGVAVLSYAQIGEDLLPRVLAALGLEVTEGVQQAIEGQQSVYSKDSRRAFVPDGEQKRREASPGARAAVERWAAEPYEALERTRREQTAATSTAR